MKLIIFTNEESPEKRESLEIGQILEDEGYNVEYLDWVSEDAETKAHIFDIYKTPAFLIVNEDGSMIEMWQGEIPTAANIKHLLAHD